MPCIQLPVMDKGLRDKLAAAGVEPQDIAREAQMALAVLKQHNKRPQSVEFKHSFDPEDAACSISLIYTFCGSWSDEAQLEDALTAQQAQHPRWAPGKLLVAFRATSARAGQAAGPPPSWSA